MRVVYEFLSLCAIYAVRGWLVGVKRCIVDTDMIEYSALKQNALVCCDLIVYCTPVCRLLHGRINNKSLEINGRAAVDMNDVGQFSVVGWQMKLYNLPWAPHDLEGYY